MVIERIAVEATVKQGTSEVAVKPVFPSLEPLKAGAMLLPADHSEAFTYDLNANVLTIERKGRDDAGRYRVVDDVEMEYVGNRLSVLRDAAADALLEGSMDMPEGVYSGYDIRYDAAGRLTRDVSRGIANINYSVTGMPWVVGTMSGDCAEYGYTSSGVKLWETIYNGNRTTRREYVGPCEYVDGKLVRINVPQGYIDSLGVLHAYIRDIQGNVAGVYAAKAGKKSLEQLNDYYAYGGLTADSRGQDRNRYKHTGKELVTDLGLNSYDFTARWQYPMAGRFDVPDALAGKTPWNSPYSFCGGDPINFVDPTGNIILFINGYIGFGSPEAGAPYWNGEKSGFVKGAEHYFHDKNIYFVAVEHSALSTAGQRIDAGREYGAKHLSEISGNLSAGETCKIITHSMGAAYGEGVAQILIENGIEVEQMIHLNPFQAGDIESVSAEYNTTTIDYQNPNDLVVSMLPEAKPGNIGGASAYVREFAKSWNPATWHKYPISQGSNFWTNLSQ